jgi:hypothetical protein
MSAVARLARIVSGSLPLRGAGPEDELERAAREAFRSAVILGSTEPLVPAVPARQTGPAAKLEPAAEGGEAEGLDPGPPGPPAVVGGIAFPEVASAASAAVALPWSAPAASPARATSPARSERGSRDPDEIAPNYLLRAPRSVTRAADDFFHGLVRRVDGDR